MAELTETWCHFCETTVTQPHECDEARWSKALKRYDFCTGSEFLGPSMDEEVYGDYVAWEDVVRLLKAERVVPTDDEMKQATEIVERMTLWPEGTRERDLQNHACAHGLAANRAKVVELEERLASLGVSITSFVRAHGCLKESQDLREWWDWAGEQFLSDLMDVIIENETDEQEGFTCQELRGMMEAAFDKAYAPEDRHLEAKPTQEQVNMGVEMLLASENGQVAYKADDRIYLRHNDIEEQQIKNEILGVLKGEVLE